MIIVNRMAAYSERATGSQDRSAITAVVLTHMAGDSVTGSRPARLSPENELSLVTVANSRRALHLRSYSHTRLRRGCHRPRLASGGPCPWSVIDGAAGGACRRRRPPARRFH